MNACARTLAAYLLGESSDAIASEEGYERGVTLVKFVRIVDRFSVNPPTTYLDPDFKRCLLRSDVFEYKQMNLAVEAKIGLAFSPSEGSGFEAFDIVFDLIGETTFDRPEIIHARQTYSFPVAIAKQAARLTTPPKAYIRRTYPYYDMRSSSTGYTEDFPENSKSNGSGPIPRTRTFSFGKEKGTGDERVLRPDGLRGKWWHESIRGIGDIGSEGEGGEKPLNLAVVRIGEGYGKGLIQGDVLARLIIGHVYQYEKEEMKFLHNPDLRVHTVHAIDVSRGLLAAAEWMVRVGGRSAADKIAGRLIPSCKSWSIVAPPGMAGADGDLPKITDPAKTVTVPLFNLVDEADSTQESIGKAIAKVFAVKHSFYGDTLTSLVQKFAKTDFNEMVEDVNEKHMEIWFEMLQRSKPPILDTPLSPFLDNHAFRKMAVNLDGSNFRKVVGFKCVKPQPSAADLEATVTAFQADKLWPTL